jgi:hypothetical protein
MEASRSWLVYRTDRRDYLRSGVVVKKGLRQNGLRQDLNTVADRARLDGLAAAWEREQAVRRTEGGGRRP